MSETYVIKPTYNELLSVLLYNKQEQPFRFQPNVRIEIDFNEYVKFCNSLIYSNLDVMYVPLKKYVKHINLNEDGIVRLFYLDVGRAIIQEVIMAGERDKNATMITAMFDKADKIISIKDVPKLASSLPKEYINFGREFAEKEKTYDWSLGSLSEHNKVLVNYGIFLMSISLHVGDGTRFNIL